MAALRRSRNEKAAATTYGVKVGQVYQSTDDRNRNRDLIVCGVSRTHAVVVRAGMSRTKEIRLDRIGNPAKYSLVQDSGL